MSAAVALRATRTWSELFACGATISIAPSTLVTVQAPADVAADLRASLAWRVEAMRAQIRDAARLGDRPVTPVAVQVEQWGRRQWVTREAQRPLPGLCASCGEPTGYETGDCVLCVAARVGALRAEGRIGAPSTWTPPPARDVAAWRDGLYAEVARPDPQPAPASRAPWTCEVCGATGQLGRRDVEGCGKCALKAADTLSLARLGGGGGGDVDEEVVFE